MEETIIYEKPHPEPGHGLILTPHGQQYLNEGAGWAKFLGIIGFIFSLLMLLLAVFAGTFFSAALKALPAGAPPVPSGLGIIVSVVYVIMAVIYFIPSLFLFQFGGRSRTSIVTANSVELTAAMSKLRSFLKFWGIITIIMLVLMIIGIIGVFAGIHSLADIKQPA